MRTVSRLPRLVRAMGYAVILCVATASVADAAQAAGGAAPPKYQSLRYEEDWSVLRQGGTGDTFDPLKFVRLTDDGRFWASFGAQLRERVEVWSDFNFGDTGDYDRDDAFLLHRLRAHMDLHAGEMFRAFVEMKSALATDRDLPGGTRPTETDSIDLQNAFLDVRLPLGEKDSFTLRGGRQEMLLGNERLVSPLDWTNTRRTFDGLSGIWNVFDWRVQSFYSHVVQIQKYNFNKYDDDIQFWGAYATRPQPFGASGPAVLDLYWLAIERARVGFNGSSGEEDRQTVGARLAGAIPNTDFDYEAEGAYQFGDVGGADVSAFMVVAEAGWGLPKTAAAPRVVAGFDYASGDDDPGDGDVETFNQLFPLGHKYLGYIDTVGRQNIIDARLQTSIVPFGTMRAALDLHNFWRASDDDALYNAAGGVVRAGTASDEGFVGSELDFTLRQPFGRHLDVLLGYSHFFAGDFIQDAGTDDEDIDFVYLQGQFTF